LVFDEDFLSDTIFECLVLLAVLLRVISDSDTSIHDWDIMHVFVVKTVDKVRKAFETSIHVVGEITVIFQVVNIGPLSIKRKTRG